MISSVLIALTLLKPFVASAGADPAILKVLDGSQHQVAKDSTNTIEDLKFSDPTYNGKLVKPYRVNNTVSLEINELSLYAIRSEFTASVTVRITQWNTNSTVDSSDRILMVQYRQGTPYTSNATFAFGSAYKVKIRILDTSSDVGWNPWNVLKVTNKLQSFPTYNFDCTADAIQTVTNTGLPFNTTADQINVSWGNVITADAYDLEWTYLDSFALAAGNYGTPAAPTPALVFDNSCTRVTITQSSFNIPLLYEGSGTLFYRVRPVQYQSGGGRTEAKWSSDYSNGFGKFTFQGHSRKLNWQSNISFAEEGKRKIVAQYFDGTLRNRQTVTKDNNLDTTIVAETFYDYQGRPVIQVLPSPTLNKTIGYYKNFNNNLNGLAYDKPDFDSLSSPANYCNTSASGMKTDSGASRYYSPNNNAVNYSYNRYIPDAKNFPFTETQYTQDNTGRIARQGGVGLMHRIGAGHETVYYYGTPDQRSLDALFGTEVGDHNHYFKTMVRDANGQYSVTYADMHGRTVATALAGSSPDSLEKLPSNVSSSITESLVDSNSVIIKDLVMESKKTLLVPVAGLDTFTYSLNPQTFSQIDCNSRTICYDCLYDLEIVITDDCNNQKLGGAAFDTVFHNFSIGSIDTLCNGTVFTKTFTKYLQEGSYEITKKLSVSRQGNDYYRDSIYAKRTCFNKNLAIQTQAALIAASSVGCTVSCDSCTARLGTYATFYAQFMSKGGIPNSDTAKYGPLALQAYNQAAAACDQLCNKYSEYDDVRAQMLLDVTPHSGQYASLDHQDDIYSIFYSDVDASPADTPQHYQRLSNYLNDLGQADKVFDEQTGTTVSPETLNDSSFAQKFKFSWADNLLQLHPEYLKLQKYLSLKESAKWDRRFESADSYAEAMKHQYLNPTNNTLSAPFNRWNVTVGYTADADPILSVGTFTTDLETILQSYLASSKIYSSPSTSVVTLWNYATQQVKCAGKDNSCFTTYNTKIDSAFNSNMCAGDLDMAWRIFRQMYLDVKRRLINQYITANTAGAPTAATLFAAGHQPRFSDALELLILNNAQGPTSTAAANTYLQSKKDSLAGTYASNCQAYATAWLQQLSTCAFYDSATINGEIIPRLVAVCKAGSDPQHPYGSSSIAPGSTNYYKSFEDVIDQYNAKHGIATSADCSAYGILAPKPYGEATVLASKPVYGVPDSCDCNRIAAVYAAYQKSMGTYGGTFSGYLLQYYQTSMSDSALNALLNRCSVVGQACYYSSAPILVPPALQCGAGDVCADCNLIKSLSSQFANKYPGLSPAVVVSPTDTASLNVNKLYERFMNYRLGYTKTASDYLKFQAQCVNATIGNYDSLQKFEDYFAQLANTTFGTYIQMNTQEGDVLNDNKKIIYNGIVHLPDSIRARSGGWYNNFLMQTEAMCWDSGYTVEVRQKFLTDIQPYNVAGDYMYMAVGDFSIVFDRYFAPDSPTPGLFLVNAADNRTGTIFDTNLYPIPNATVNSPTDWTIYKIKMTPSSWAVYFNGVLVHTYPRDPASHVQGHNQIVMGMIGRQGAVDWVKVSDRYGTVKWSEDFNNPNRLSIPDFSFFCPNDGPSCEDYFTYWYNNYWGTTYRYGQIDTLYLNTLGRHPSNCSINPVSSTDTCTKFTFYKTLGGTIADTLLDVVQTKDGGYISSGWTKSFGQGGLDGYIVKTDKKGNPEWSKAYGGAANDEFHRIKQTFDSGYIAVGSTRSFHQSQGEFFVVKTSPDGNVQWSKAFAAGTTHGEFAVDVIQNSDSGYTVLGLNDLASGSSDWEVIRLSQTGSVLWSKKIGTNSSDNLGSMVEDSGKIVFGGVTVGASMYDAVLIKLDRNTGNVVLKKIYDLQAKSNWALTLSKTKQGYRANMIDANDYNLTDARDVIMDVKADGTFVRAKLLPKPPNGTVTWGSGSTTSDGGCIYTQGQSNATGDITLHKLDSNLNITWTNIIKRPGTQYLYSVIQNKDGSYTGVGYDGTKAVMLKTNAQGRTTCLDSMITTTDTTVTSYSVDTLPILNSGTLTFSNPDVLIYPLVAATAQTLVCGTDSCAIASGYTATLCGRATSTFAPAVFDAVSSCSDSSFFAISKGTEVYQAYLDSAMTNFDSLYRSKCMNAYKYESFTVKHVNSEYHYTLYYYDQAGNLLKTVSPAGINANYTQSFLDSVALMRSKSLAKTPGHLLYTQYRYNTLNQVVAQQTPDAGQSLFWYDRLGRLTMSQNAKQKSASTSETNRQYSYTLYDGIGRITEVGQIANAGSTAMTDSISRKASLLDSWITASAAKKEQITQTVYDAAYPGLTGYSPTKIVQRNLRNRVSYTSFTTGYNPANYDNASFYTYDIQGNVDTLLQDYGSNSFTVSQNVMNMNGNRFKRMVYNYDLISGKVNLVSYQPKTQDEFYYHYIYDAENRITDVETSADSVIWVKQAHYDYYKHGPLARMTLGNDQVQGVDYAYTLQGWLKGVNSMSLRPGNDMGNDAQPTSANKYVSNDAYGFQLNYYTNDYVPISATVAPFPGTYAYLGAIRSKGLYNGNISSMGTNIYALYQNDSATTWNLPQLYNYTYDQLNRLTRQDVFHGLNQNLNTWSGYDSLTDFKERVAYDPNGNITKYLRNSSNNAGSEHAMDSLNYFYNAGTNRLNHISDNAADYIGGTLDLENQPGNNVTQRPSTSCLWMNAEIFLLSILVIYGSRAESGTELYSHSPRNIVFVG